MEVQFYCIYQIEGKKKKKYIGNLNPYKDVASHDPFGHNMATPLCMVMLSQVLWAYRWFCFSSNCTAWLLPAPSIGSHWCHHSPQPSPHPWGPACLGLKQEQQDDKKKLLVLGIDFSSVHLWTPNLQSGLKNSGQAVSVPGRTCSPNTDRSCTTVIFLTQFKQE